MVPVREGSRTLKDAINEAFRDWVARMDDTHYVLGTACGPQPLPCDRLLFPVHHRKRGPPANPGPGGRLPARVYACVGGGSNALGIFSGFMDSPVELVGVEAGGRGPGAGRHAARLALKEASVGVAQGYKTFFLQDGDGQMNETHSIAAGLDYVGVSPILASLHVDGKARFEAVTDGEVLDAFALTLKRRD